VERLCIERITAGSDDKEDWALLALAVRSRRDLTTFAITRFPEVISALHDTLRERYDTVVDPLELATWTAPLLIRQDDRSFRIATTPRLEPLTLSDD
jgi:hypothetical protein